MKKDYEKPVVEEVNFQSDEAVANGEGEIGTNPTISGEGGDIW